MAQVTVGLDFGTHQTKICIEKIEDEFHKQYEFFPFYDLDGKKNYVLPSVIQINDDNTISYGYVDGSKKKTEIPIDEFVLPPMPSIDVDVRANQLWKILHHGEDANKELSVLRQMFNVKHRQDIAKWEAECIELEKEFEKTKAKTSWSYRYFKQAAFNSKGSKYDIDPEILSIWYLSYIVFKLEEIYGQEFAIQVGMPTGDRDYKIKKRKAVKLILSAYHLVEDVFQNDFGSFIHSTYQELLSKTEKVPYSDEKKEEYSILAFPEAYASLLTLTARNKLSTGMNLMIDIGGGTTDISFFTIWKKRPRIYDYYSLDKGLNYLVENSLENTANIMTKQYSLQDKAINQDRLKAIIGEYFEEIKRMTVVIMDKLKFHFREQTRLEMSKLRDALENRIILYAGGGSTYQSLRRSVETFSDKHSIDASFWEDMDVKDIEEIKPMSPILATAFGLSISQHNDDVHVEKLANIFFNIKVDEEDKFNKIDYLDSKDLV